MTIVTAHTESWNRIGRYCAMSMARYWLMNPDTKIIREIIPDDYSRPASWFKLALIAKHLPSTDFVLWLDADAEIISPLPLETILQPHTLNIAKDENGINCGVMAWRNDEFSAGLLKRVNEMTEFENHIWWEQAALMSILNEVDVYYQSKPIFNAYPGEETFGTHIRHWPGMSVEEREPLMKAALC